MPEVRRKQSSSSLIVESSNGHPARRWIPCFSGVFPRVWELGDLQRVSPLPAILQLPSTTIGVISVVPTPSNGFDGNAAIEIQADERIRIRFGKIRNPAPGIPILAINHIGREVNAVAVFAAGESGRSLGGQRS